MASRYEEDGFAVCKLQSCRGSIINMEQLGTTRDSHLFRTPYTVQFTISVIVPAGPQQIQSHIVTLLLFSAIISSSFQSLIVCSVLPVSV